MPTPAIPLHPSRLAEDRTSAFRGDVVGWTALGRVLWSAGLDQLAPSPKSWPRTVESYGRRFATRSVQLVATEGTRHGVAALLDQTTDYVPCECIGTAERLGHVALGVVTGFDAAGERKLAWPKFAGALVGAYVLGRLQPGQGAPHAVLTRALTGVGLSVLGNLASEFAPSRSEQAPPSSSDSSPRQ